MAEMSVAARRTLRDQRRILQLAEKIMAESIDNAKFPTVYSSDFQRGAIWTADICLSSIRQMQSDMTQRLQG